MRFFGPFAYAGFGRDEVFKPVIFSPSKRYRLNACGVAVSIFVPWALFVGVLWVVTFRIHYDAPYLCWSFVLAGFSIAAIIGTMSYCRYIYDRDPSWYAYNAGLCFLAVLIAAGFGNYLFWEYTHKYYDYSYLNTYVAVDSAKYSGQTVMDGGRIYFTSGTHLDKKSAMGFKHGDTYCVAPIVSTGERQARHDFWAVGVNCCNDANKFNCGEAANRRVRSGLRDMNEDRRPFYRLAVQQAEAAYGLTASNPIFVTWTQDPVKEVNSYLKESSKGFVRGSLAAFGINFVLVVFATISFGQMRSHGILGH